MGSVGLASPRLGAFNSDIYPRGLDLGRCVILQDIGVFRADDSATFQAGMLVAQNAAGNIIKAVSKPVLGVAKWNKATTLTAAVVDEQLTWAVAATTVLLAHQNVSNFQLRSAANLGGSAYTGAGGDYTLTASSGAVLHVAAGGGGTIPLATTVYATYTYDLSTRELDFQGRNFWNYTDDVSIADGRITVITDASILFTSQYDTSRVYDLTTTAKNLYCGGNTSALAGLFTNDSGEGAFVGHVIQLPTADDPFLGVRLGGDPVIVA